MNPESVSVNVYLQIAGEIMSKFVILRMVLAFLLFGAQALYAQSAPSAPIQIKVVVVTMFERGEDTGDAARRIPAMGGA